MPAEPVPLAGKQTGAVVPNSSRRPACVSSITSLNCASYRRASAARR
jgi:hypothetical protein